MSYSNEVSACTKLHVSITCVCVRIFRMTKFDVRNYFEKIYGLKVASVHTRIQKGKLQRDKKQPNKFLKKKGDTKVAYLTLVS